MTSANDKRRLNELWEDRHTHDGENLQEQIKIIRQTVEEQDDGLAAAGSGAYVHLVRTATQTIAVGGEPVEWDTSHLIVPFEFVVALPATSVTIPKAGYYNVTVSGKWESFAGGGTVWVVRTRDGSDLTVWPPAADPSIWSATSGRIFTPETAEAIPCLVGDEIAVYIDHGSTATPALGSATLVVELVDRGIGSTSLSYFTVVMSDGPVAYWRLDETSGTSAADSSGNGHNGTYVGSPTLGADGVMDDGTGSPSAEFDGSTQWVTVPLASVLGLDDVTVEAWINFDTTAQMGIFNVNRTGADDNRWGLWKISTGKLEYSAGTLGVVWESDTPLSIDTAYHVVMTRSAAGALKFYVNGVLDGEATVDVTVGTSGDTVQIGMDVDPAGNTDWFNGHIDEVAVYDRVLTAAEVAEHYIVGSSG